MRKNQENMKKTIVVIGGTGFVGSYFLALSKKFKNSIIAPTRKELDITNKQSVISFFKRIKPEFVINFAGYTNINDSEKERKNRLGKTWVVNVVGVENLVEACKKANSFLIQISTDAVFPGTKDYPGPYAENAKPAKNEKTINWYGVSKLHAEKEAKKLKRNFAILRISHPFGNPRNDRDLIAKTLKDIEEEHTIFKDQLFTPTFIDDLAKAIWTIQEKKISGIFHIGCKGLVSRVEFDRHLLKLLNRKMNLIEGSMEEFLKYSSARTRLGGFQTEYTEKILGVTFHTWRDALKKVAKNLF